MHFPLPSERKRLSLAIRRTRRDSGGFVLVAVLLLIALATVLIVTTSGVSQIERKAISNSANQEVARQNALFALNLAVSQLQVAAGPDQRVTATADILNTSNSTTASPIAQPYWTGVWKSVNPTFSSTPWFRPQPLDVSTTGVAGTAATALRPWSTTGGATNSNVTWLVSGATNNSVVSPLLATTNWMTNKVMLASNWGTGTNGSITGGTWTNPTTVYVPLVTMKIGTTNVGQYAYWVSDEGVKAKVSLKDTNMTTGSISTISALIPSLLHYFAPSAPRVASVATNLGITSVLTTDFRSNTNLSKLTSLAGLAFITNSVPALSNNTLAADLTVHSYGVLSDTRLGGLKQDLTAALESTSAAASTNFTILQARSGSGAGNDASSVYCATNLGIPAITTAMSPIGQGGVIQPSATTVIDGLRWQSLYFYYNLYKQSMPQSPISTNPTAGVTPSGVGAPNMSGPNAIANRDPLWYEANTTGRFVMGAMAPVQIADRLDAAIEAVTTTVKVGTNMLPGYNFKIRYYPMVVLHNPYAVSLVISNTATFSLSKDIGNNLVSLTCATNKVTNAAWGYKTIVGNVTNYSWQPGPVTLTNLYPYDTNSGANTNGNTTPTTAVVVGTGYPMNQTCTNMSTMAPGEIRVYALPSSAAVLAFETATTFTNLVSSASTTLDACQYYNVGTVARDWQGTTNGADLVTLNLPSTSFGNYNALRFYPNQNSITGWPGAATASSYGYGFALPGVLASPPAASAPTASWTSLSIASMVNNPYRIMLQFERLKGVNSVVDSNNYSFTTTNLPLFMGNSTRLNAGRTGGAAAAAGIVSMPSTEVSAKVYNQMTSFTLLQNAVSGSALTTSWGLHSVGADTVDTSTSKNNNSKIVLRDVPIAPMTSLGQFMHLDDRYFDQEYMAINIGGMSVGGSFASPEIGLASTCYFVSGLRSCASVDHSFMANESLFDTYLFSTVPPPNGFNWGTGGYGAFSNSSISAAGIAANQPLPNSRYVYYRKNGSNPIVADLQNESKVTANLLLDGAFNVNSTSVAAWKALLTSLAGHTFHTYNYLTGSALDITPSSLPSGYPYPIPRFCSVSRSTPNDPWEGMRALSDAQITALATEIVKQVRARGPFLSMGDFLNRRLGTSATGVYTTSANGVYTNTMGALQNAIENTQTNGSTYDVNANIRTASYGTGGISKFKAPQTTADLPPNGVADIITNTATGIPGYLMQQDLVQAFSAVMAPRSDTFVIRVYGETDKPSVNPLTPSSTYGQAWGEAVVQRLPEYFDQTDPALVSGSIIPGISYALGDATPLKNSSGVVINQSNQNFGRRFKIISFRWLNQNEL